MPAELIKDIFQRNGFNLTEEQIQRFDLYLRELKRWNKVHNLTSLEEDEQIIKRHFLDSLTLTLCIEEKGIDVKGKKVCDVGSGAGFPGVPLKIFYQDAINLTLIESVSKKCSFLEYLKVVLDIDYRVLCTRAEKVKEKFYVVVSRALGPLEETLPLLINLSEAYIMVMKGREPVEGFEYCYINLPDIKGNYILLYTL
ncbi:methyltransferase GidB [Thermocrinis albus DSM 14484]|uniref:Ribosomal RNA small subunit methyltransferase G n=1 Tax=Thermocrinis albus (strain DSM 14484 / JCM 11386 / HI 11/12) TaxID=638303 RepID=D3SLC4_THEAH|nr:methyltransferase GidB [Thermocrinis albus DSM 14484]